CSKAAARDKQEKDDMERAQVLQKQYDDKKENIDWNILKLKNMVRKLEKKKISKHSGFKRLRKIEDIDAYEDITLVDIEKDEEVVTIDAEPLGRINQEEVNDASKGIEAIDAYEDITLVDTEKDEENMARYKMEHLRGMAYDKVRPIFKRECKKVQTLFKLDTDVEEPKKKRVVDETLLQESFKKLKAVEVKYPIIDWEIHTEGSRTYWKIIRVSGITEAYQIPSVDKEKALWVELKRLFEPDADDVLWKLQRHDMFMLTEKDYPLSNAVMTLMLSAKLQVEEDNEMARDLVINIFIEANKPKSRSLDTSSK
nr:hypothetical protein [Tanacetum cinerariifolium]GEZ27113.1 hypothetical protein [Tanacetum cinerariifolium]